MTDQRPQIRLRPNKSPQRIRHGFPWAYENEIVTDRRTRKIPAGTIVELLDTDKNYLATCAFNAESRIAARILDTDPGAKIDAPWLAARLARALALRETLFDTPFYRLIHAEADGLPGLIIDRFGSTIVLQPNAAWIDALIPELVTALTDVLGQNLTIVKNAAGRARGLEGLDEDSAILQGEITAPIPVPMNGATYMADVIGGQKTGLFFDQRPNHAFAANLAKGGRVLDVFSHVGGFSLAALAAGASSALAVDGSAPALALAEAGAKASGFAAQFETRKGDAFEVMLDLTKSGEKFDVVICDPPAFAPAKPALEAGLRAYEKTARIASNLVAPGGYLVLCSCSHAADLEAFRKTSLRGIGKAGRDAQLIHTGFAGPDHPVHAHLAETAYLKALFTRLI